MTAWRSLTAALVLALVFAALPAFAALGFNDRGGGDHPAGSELTVVVTDTPVDLSEPEPMARGVTEKDCDRGYEPIVEG